MRKNAILNAIRGGDCTVLGYGVSNRPLVEWLISHGAGRVTVRDKRDANAMEASGDAARLRELGVSLVCGEDYLSGLSGDVIFRSPGIRPDLPDLRALYGTQADGFSPGAIGVFSYLRKIAFGLRHFAALNRKFDLALLNREDLIPLTQAARELL